MADTEFIGDEIYETNEEIDETDFADDREKEMTVNEALEYAEHLKRDREIEQTYADNAAACSELSDADSWVVVPGFSVKRTAERLKELDEKLASVHHAIAAFEATCIVPGFDRTVGEVKELMKEWEKRLDWLGGLLSKPVLRRVSKGTPSRAASTATFNRDEVWTAYRALEALLEKARVAVGELCAKETITIVF